MHDNAFLAWQYMEGQGVPCGLLKHLARQAIARSEYPHYTDMEWLNYLVQQYVCIFLAHLQVQQAEAGSEAQAAAAHVQPQPAQRKKPAKNPKSTAGSEAKHV